MPPSALLLVALLLLTPAVCFSRERPAKSADRPLAVGEEVRKDTRMTQALLDQHCLAFGERYLIAIGNGCNLAERASGAPEARSRAHSFKLQMASSVYDILSGPNPFAKLMDLILLAELQHLVWGVEGNAAKVFGEKAAPPLVAALAEGRRDVWELADRVLKPEQHQALEEMIREWRQKNPSAESIAFVRFGEFAAYRGKSILDGVPLGHGLLAPVSEATRQLEETRLIAERAMFLAKRMPLLARWHAESYLNTVVQNPEVRKLTDSVPRAVAVAEALPAKISQERAILLKAAEEREKGIGAIMKDVRAATADVREMAREAQPLLQETRDVIKAVDVLAAKFASPPGGPAKEGRPFDVREFSQAAREGTRMIKETRALLESPAWTAHVSHVKQEARRLVYAIAGCAAALIGLVFVLAVTYRRMGRQQGSRGAT